MVFRNCSQNLINIKRQAKNQISGIYSDEFVNLIVDRKFSRIPLSLRFTNYGYIDESQAELILNLMSNTSLTKKEIIRELFLTSFLILNLILALIFNRSKIQNSRINPSFVYSLTPEQILNSGSTDLLEKFFREPRFQKLFLGKKIVVESKQVYRFMGNNIHKDLEVTFDTSVWIAKNVLNRKAVLNVTQESITRFIRVLKKREKDQLLILREYVIDEPLWRHYIQRTQKLNTINIVTTQSHFLRLPYAFYLEQRNRITRSMLWYSTNSDVIPNRRTHATFDPSHFKLANIDSHFVWTAEHKKSLMSLNPNAEVVAVGSILFIPTKSAVRENRNISTEIVIFDVTPLKGLGVEVFYSDEILLDFIHDIVEILHSNGKTKSSRILLKPKRRYSRKLRGGVSSSIKYIDSINRLQQHNRIEVLRPDVNLYDLIGRSWLVIGIPFTSPVILAKEFKVPCVYYVPESASDWIIGKSKDGVVVLKGKNELRNFIQDL